MAAGAIAITLIFCIWIVVGAVTNAPAQDTPLFVDEAPGQPPPEPALPMPEAQPPTPAELDARPVPMPVDPEPYPFAPQPDPLPFFGEPASDATLVLLALAAFALYRYARRKSRRTHAESPEPGAGKEKELLRAIERHGEITAVRAALETRLSVEEADRMLGDLAARGHLRVHATDGRLAYTL